MAYKTSYEFHHNFVKLADESGFTFNTHKPRVHIDWNEIRSVDVDALLRDRKFTILEKHLNDILDCALESEFDVRILDQGVVKMFRLAQLTIEYQQFCRHYLDRSVYVLRNELTTVLQDMEAARKDIRDRDDEIRKLKKKTKHTKPSPTMLYGHENIANMILKTLSNNGEMFPSKSFLDSGHQYNKCTYCDKVFLNQLYLKSHVIRRHPNVAEVPQKDTANIPNNGGDNEHTKLNTEIMELKAKLLEMETTMTNFNESKIKTTDNENNTNAEESNFSNKNADITTDHTLLEKIKEWKNEEHIKYSKEIDILRTQMFEAINTVKEQETKRNNENATIEQLNQTIKEQSQLIVTLKKEITDNITKAENEKMKRQNELEAQILTWMQKVENQTQQYQTLVETLNHVTKELQEARAEAEVERSRAANVQAILTEQFRNDKIKDEKLSSGGTSYNSHQNTEIKPIDNKKVKKAVRQPNRTPEIKSLEDLHQKAQALLNMKSSSSSTDDLSEINYKYGGKLAKTTNNVKKEINGNRKNIRKTKEEVVRIKKHEADPEIKETNKIIHNHVKNKPHVKTSKKEKKTNLQTKTSAPVGSRSPLRVVRAKLTEEVNNRLIATGVDPLKNGLNQSAYNKKRMQLQQEQRHKIKKNPSYESTRNSILANVDIMAGSENITSSQYTYTPTKSSKSFSFASVMSNVKNKALSLVKHNERLSMNEVTKKAVEMLKTLPDSANSSLQNISPKHVERRNPLTMSHLNRQTNVLKDNLAVPIVKKLNTDTIKNTTLSNSDDDSLVSQESDDATDSENDHKYYDSTFLTKSAKSIDKLIKSPVRRPSTATGDYNGPTMEKHLKNNNVADIFRTQSDSNILEVKDIKPVELKLLTNKSNDDVATITKNIHARVNEISESNILTNPKQAKGVLKNAPSISSLNKKKVLFDMDAIQMKSISASPSQSTEKSDSNHEKYELGLINLDDDEWDISSIDNEPLKNNDEHSSIKIIPRTSPKIAELKNTIELQLARRNETASTVLVGGVDVLRGPVTRAASVGGSNTSLGSSVFDDTDNAPMQDKPKVKQNEHVDSDLDISEFSIDGEGYKKRDSF